LENDDDDLRPWHALQIWLKCAEHRVVIPFANAVADLVPPVAVRLRRDFPTVMSLVQAHALLHQASRERDNEGRIIATLEEDYAIVRGLVKGFMAEAAERAVPKTVRETVIAVSEILDEGPILDEGGPAARRFAAPPSAPPSATIRQIADVLEIDRSAAQRRVREGIARGFLTSPEETKQPLPELASNRASSFTTYGTRMHHALSWPGWTFQHWPHYLGIRAFK
jgi:hypothetical protein